MRDRDSAESIIGATLAAIAFAWALTLALLGAHEALLYCAPALLIAAPLMLRRYPGERLLEKAALALAARRPRAASAPAQPLPRRGPLVRIRGGGRLLASFLASRPPPVSALT
jgi:hypothetical protein